MTQRAMFARFTPVAGREAEADRLVEALTRAVRREPGNLSHMAYRVTGVPMRYHIHEVYRDEAALRAHLGEKHTQAFNEGLKQVAEDGASEVTELSAVVEPAPRPADAPRGVDHAGLTVPDLEAAARFLAEAFGAVPVYDVLPKGEAPMEGADPERQLGLPRGGRIVHMRLMRLGQGPTLELFQAEAVPQQPAAGIADRGLTHLGLYVDDIAAAARRFEAAGGTLLSAVHPLSGVEDGAGNAGVYGRTPWGTLFELLTYPAGIAYPADAPATRWTPAS